MRLPSLDSNDRLRPKHLPTSAVTMAIGTRAGRLSAEPVAHLTWPESDTGDVWVGDGTTWVFDHATASRDYATVSGGGVGSETELPLGTRTTLGPSSVWDPDHASRVGIFTAGVYDIQAIVRKEEASTFAAVLVRIRDSSHQRLQTVSSTAPKADDNFQRMAMGACVRVEPGDAFYVMALASSNVTYESLHVTRKRP